MKLLHFLYFLLALSLFQVACSPKEVEEAFSFSRPQINIRVPDNSLSITGSQTKFFIALNSKPLKSVSIPLSINDSENIQISTNQLVFTPEDWKVEQEVSVTTLTSPYGKSDAVFTILVDPVISEDKKYDGLDPDDITLTRLGLPNPAIAASKNMLTVSEDGTSDTFTVSINVAPLSPVTVGISSSLSSEALVNPTSITFTSENWQVPQIVTITGVNDDLDDDNQVFSVQFSSSFSAESDFNNIQTASVNAVNQDNDTIGFLIGTIQGSANENGQSATATVTLATKPTNDVVVTIASQNTTEILATPSQMTFTPNNWNVPQTLTLTGIDDLYADGEQTVPISFSFLSSDTKYSTLETSTLSVSNLDNDTTGFTVTSLVGVINEGGGSGTFTVKLNSKPYASVTIPISVNPSTEVTINVSSLIFTASDWNTPKTVTVTGVNDLDPDGPVSFTITLSPATSSDAQYNNLKPNNVTGINYDNDFAGVAVSNLSGSTSEGGTTATFTMQLNSQPSSDVTIPISVSPSTEAAVNVSSLVFTASDWNTPKTVTITGVNDVVVDGPQNFTVTLGLTTSSDTNYNNLDPSDFSGTNNDNDVAGFTISAISGNTTETSGTATFTVSLNSQPTDPVVIYLSSSNPSEGTISLSSLTFNSGNWSSPQTVTVTGIDDNIDDGDKNFSIVLEAAQSSDPNYNTLNPNDVDVINTDNDVAGYTLSSISGNTTEAGSQFQFSIKLNSQPTSNVIIAFSSSDTTEGTVNTSQLTFTPSNWNTNQNVIITGVNDYIVDDLQTYSITSSTSSSDSNYNGLNPSSVSVVNNDNDVAGVTVTSVSGNVSESGTQATFGVYLNSQPSDNVSISISSSDTSAGIITNPVSPLVFTPSNWNLIQTVTITGVDDAVIGNTRVFTVALANASSNDSNYSGLNPNDVTLSCIDNDAAGFTITPLVGSLTEGGGQGTFTIVLNSAVQANKIVSLSIASADVTEASVSPDIIEFTDADWSSPQTITVTGLDDSIVDGNQNFNINISIDAATTDTNYDSLSDPSPISVTNIDNDVAGFTVSTISGNTTESGATATFTIRLNSQPSANVTIGFSSNDPTEGTVSPSTFTFTPANWNSNQVITTTGVNDDAFDGPATFTIVTTVTSTTDTNYSALNPADVSVINLDNDTAGFIISSISGFTTEAGGTASFTVSLTTAPTSNVTINLSSSNSTEGTVSPSSLIFTSTDWNAQKTVTVTGTDDAIADGNQTYNIITSAASSSDIYYNEYNPSDVSVTNVDNDTAGFTISSISGNSSESGGTATFTIKLNSEPTYDVTIALSSSDASEGTVDQSSVTFTPTNWNSIKTITVTGVDDALQDGNQNFHIITSSASSSDSRYNNMDPPNISIINTDNDSSGITVSAVSGNTSENNGGTATFTLVLNSLPSYDVIIPISSSDTTEGTVDQSSITFTSINWNAPQTITITGVDDGVLVDGNQAYFIDIQAATSSDPNYNGLNPPNVNLTNLDNDSPGVILTTVSGNTSETGTTATFAAKLASPPSANVTFTLTSSDTSEGTVSPDSITFTSTNWNSLQTVTITGVNDSLADGDQQYQIITGTTFSGDSSYNNLAVTNITLNNIDDDSPGIILSRNSGLVVTEAGTEDTFTIVLGSAPTGNVTINLSSSNTGEGVVNPTQIVFTPSNWMNEQTVTITGVDDLLIDGNKLFTIVTSSATSSDPIYNNMNPSDVTIMNQDNETPGFTIEPNTSTLFPILTSEDGLSNTFTVRLNSQPTSNVTLTFNIPASYSDEGSLNTTSITFTPDNWAAPQNIIITGLNDAIADGDQTYQITMATAVSSDSNYNGRSPTGPYIKNSDNDSPGVTVTPYTSTSARIIVNEGGSSEDFYISLRSAPSADVTIDLTSSSSSQGGTVSPSSLTFTQDNWNIPQTATVTAVNDASTSNKDFYITINPQSSDSAYNSLSPSYAYFRKIDNDAAKIIISVDTSTLAPLQTTEGLGQASFTVRLSKAPTANVTIPLSSNALTEGTIFPNSLTFTPEDWNSPQTITITGQDDSIVDGNILYKINFSNSSSSDSGYNGQKPSPSRVDVQNLDND